MRTIGFLLVSIFFGCYVAVAEPYYPPVPMEKIILQKTKRPVPFYHGTHADYACEACHHPVAGDPVYAPCSASGCHDNFDRKAKDFSNYYKTMHKKTGSTYETCVSCHAKIAGQNKQRRKKLVSCKGSACHESTN